MLCSDSRSIIGEGGETLHIFVFIYCKNNQFQKKLMMQNTIYEICGPPNYKSLVLFIHADPIN